VLELSRLLDGDGEVQVALGANHIRVQLDGVRLTSKLIDGRFPEYSRVVPAQPKNTIKADRNLFRQALQRTAILSNEKYRGVRLELAPNSVVLQANNPEQEEAVETLSQYMKRHVGSTSTICSTRWRPSIASRSNLA
jgi:DNA polymerase-3 subunit beta